MKVLIAALAIGFPLTVILAWAFEITPEGIVRSDDVLPNASITRNTGRKLTATIVVVAVIAAGMFAFQFTQTGTHLRGALSAQPKPDHEHPSGVSLPISEKSI